MKKVMVYFDFFGRKLKTEITVYNEHDENEVIEKLSDRINVLKVQLLEETPEEKTNSSVEGQRLFNQLFNGFRK